MGPFERFILWIAYRCFAVSKWWIERTYHVRVAVRRVPLDCLKCGKSSHVWVYPLDNCAKCFLKEAA